MHFDIIIVGAGVVGLSLSLALGQAGFSVCIVEKQSLGHLNDPLDLLEYDMRVFAINLVSQQWFQSLAVWDQMQAYRVSPYESMQVWDAQGSGHIQFDCEVLIEPELGHIIEQKVILKALWEKVKQYNNITIKEKAALVDLTLGESLANLYMHSGRLSANLIVGADGAHSWVREQAGLKRMGWSYGQSALVATIHTQHPHHKTARQRFAADGPLALLPLADPHCCSIVWMTTPERVAYLQNLSADVFSQVLTQSFGDSLGTLSLHTDKRAVFPLHMQHVRAYARPGCVLVGDAAHVIHPLAGQGVNLGLQNVKTLSNLLHSQKNKGHTLGAWGGLKKYERQEKSQALLMIAAMEGFKRGFGTENGLVTQLRNVGLNFVNDHYMMKKLFINLAMGK